MAARPRSRRWRGWGSLVWSPSGGVRSSTRRYRFRVLVQSLAVPKPDSSLSAVIVSGGKQYRVAPGDRILVDRLAAEPGSSVKLGRVLLFSHGDEIKVGNPAVDGIGLETEVEEKEAPKAKPKGRAKAAPKKKAAAPKAQVVEETAEPVEEEKEE